MRGAVAAWCMVTALVFVPGCGGDSGPEPEDGTSTAKGVPDADGNVPFEVLRRAIMAANVGDFDGAKHWILKDSAMGTTVGGIDVLPRKWPPFTRNGQIVQVEFIGDEYHGHDARVMYRLQFRDGSTFHEKASLTKEDNRWKITFMTETAMF